MRISKITLVILVSMLLLSILLANVVNLLSTDVNIPITQPKKKPIYYKIDDTTDHMIWFLQISDIHISIFQDPYRITDFKDFCSKTINAIKPPVVLASGDLTDAKTRDSIGSRQFEKEWRYYRNILNECNIREKTKWLDIRGNHDNFNVAGSDSSQNYFANYSVQGRQNPHSYMHQIKLNKDLFSFIGVDACLEPGPRRPFNFIGLIDQIEIDQINALINRTKASGSKYSIWFGHFPTSCILSTGNEDIRKLIEKDGNSLVYVCGHLHKLGGLIPQMYTLQKSGFLELELGDWKDNRVYRLLAIDHGLLSFVDVPHGQWPIGLITNPKHGLFLNPLKENLDNIRDSTHIRVLAFSLGKIEFVKVRIDGDKWFECYQVNNGSLYALKWSPKKYQNGVHNIDLYIKDVDGRESFYNQPFVLDGTKLSFNWLSRFVLMIDVSSIFRAMFLGTLFICIAPLLICRSLNKICELRKVNQFVFFRKRNCCNLWFRKFWILSTIDRIFWPLILYPIYLSFGPWTVGYLVEDHLGIIFAWGIYVNGSYLPGSFTYAYGFIQLVTFQVPLTFIMAHGVDRRFQYRIKAAKNSICARIGLQLPFILVFTLQLVMAYLFWLAYGTLAFVLGPLRTWSLILAAILWYNVIYLPEKCTKKAVKHFELSAPHTAPSTSLNLKQ